MVYLCCLYSSLSLCVYASCVDPTCQLRITHIHIVNELFNEFQTKENGKSLTNKRTQIVSEISKEI